MIIGVDTDWTVSAGEYREVIFTSVVKNTNVAVFDAIQSALEENFKGGTYIGTLENNGVGIAEISGASADLLGILDKIRADIILGNINISP